MGFDLAFNSHALLTNLVHTEYDEGMQHQGEYSLGRPKAMLDRSKNI